MYFSDWVALIILASVVWFVLGIVAAFLFGGCMAGNREDEYEAIKRENASR